jgi:hypothetical protein
MLLLLVYRLLRCLVGLLAVLVRSDLSKDAESVHALPSRFVIPAGRRARWRARPGGLTCRLGSGRGQGRNAHTVWSIVITSTSLYRG